VGEAGEMVVDRVGVAGVDVVNIVMFKVSSPANSSDTQHGHLSQNAADVLVRGECETRRESFRVGCEERDRDCQLPFAAS
jgi:hypothetical protein